MVFGLFRKKPEKQSRLALLLRDYPAAIPPHLGETTRTLIGAGPRLTPEQALENFNWHNAVRSERLAILAGLMAHIGLDQKDVFDAARRQSVLQARDQWLGQELPQIGSDATRDRRAWEEERPDGDYIIFSLLRDFAMLDEEIMLRAVPGAMMVLDTDKHDADMAHYMRPCIGGLVDRLYPDNRLIQDFAGSWFGFYQENSVPRLYEPAPRELPGGYLAELMDRYVAAD